MDSFLNIYRKYNHLEPSSEGSSGTQIPMSATIHTQTAYIFFVSSSPLTVREMETIDQRFI